MNIILFALYLLKTYFSFWSLQVYNTVQQNFLITWQHVGFLCCLVRHAVSRESL